MNTYRTILQWDHWLTQFLGASVLSVEQKFLTKLLANHYVKHGLLMCSHQHILYQFSNKNQVTLSPMMNRNKILNTLRVI